MFKEDIKKQLLRACRDVKDVKSVQDILKKNPLLVNERLNNDGYTALIWCTLRRHLEMITYLLGIAELDVNLADVFGYTPLHSACWKGYTEIVKMFLNDSRTNPNLPDEDGNTPLHRASAFGEVDSIRLILIHPTIDPNIKNKRGLTPLETACDHCFTSEKRSRKQMIRNIIKLKCEALSNGPKVEETAAGVPMEDPVVSDNPIAMSIEQWLKGNASAAEKSNMTKWNRSKIMLVGAGRAGKTALTHTLVGEEFNEKLESTIGIEEFTCDVKEVTSIEQPIENMNGRIESSSAWNRNKEDVNMLEASIAKEIRRKNKNPPPATTTVKEGEERSAEKAQSIQSTENKNLPLNFKKTESSLIEDKESNNLDGGTAFIQNLESFYDESDANKRIRAEDVNKDEIMKCLADNVTIADSKYILSIFDYGGQSIFNVIHPFFLTKYGIYIVVFDMRQLVSTQPSSSSPATTTADEKAKKACLKNLRFWLNSIVVHSFDEKSRRMAPILLVGTRKDMIQSAIAHEEIATLLATEFENHRAWPFIVTNDHGKGKKGNTRFCFFPVDNRKGKKEDETISELIKMIEKSVEHSFYVGKEIPFVWLQVIDEIKKRAEYCVSYEEMIQLAKEIGLSEKSIPHLLRLMHEMGLAMWHEEAGLREIIILNPIEYFVKPATIIICKHKPVAATVRDDDNLHGHHDDDDEEDDATWHLLPIHEECRQLYYDDWKMMCRTGIFGRKLLYGLLSKIRHRDHVKELMKIYGLLFSFSVITNTNHSNNNNPISDESSGVSKMYYLVPALLPPAKDNRSNKIQREQQREEEDNDPLKGYHFYFAFYTMSFLERKIVTTKEEIAASGFLPQGLYERLLCRVISVCMEESNNRDTSWTESITNASILLNYRGQRFAMICNLSENLIEINTKERNPIPIYLLLFQQIEIICQETYRTLKVMPLLSYKRPAAADDSTNYLISLSSIESCVQENRDLQIISSSFIGRRGRGEEIIPFAELKRNYNVWLFHYKQSLALSNYDIFLSYRWNEQDSALVNALFHQFSSYNIFLRSSSSSSSSETARLGGDTGLNSPVSVFVDHQRLQDGEDFRAGFVSALLQSRIVVPVITVAALQRMIHHDPSQVDNLLLEWILCVHLNESSELTASMKIIPIVFGSYVLHPETKEIRQIFAINDPHLLREATAAANGSSSTKEENLVNITMLLSSNSIIPTRTIEVAEVLLTKAKGRPISLLKLTIAEIIDKMLTFQGIFLTGQDVSLNNPQKLNQFTKKLADRQMKSLQQIYDNLSISISSAVDLFSWWKEKKIRTPNDQYFYNYSIGSSEMTLLPSSSLSKNTPSSALPSTVALVAPVTLPVNTPLAATDETHQTNTIIPLSSLNAEQTILFFQSLGCPTIQTIFNNQEVVLTGGDLMFIEEISDLKSLGLSSFPMVKLRFIMSQIEQAKEQGINISHLKPIK